MGLRHFSPPAQQYVHDEVDSTSDVSYDDSLNRKRTQHALRIRLLLACSWL